jgi:SAM-dependent methyltransferase
MIEFATTQTLPWKMACPICGGVLYVHNGSARCQACTRLYACTAGIWHFLPQPPNPQPPASEPGSTAAPPAQTPEPPPDPAHYRALPHTNRHAPQAALWHLRARSYQIMMESVVQPFAARYRRPLAVLDLGAGNGWLSYRLAQVGHHSAAVDLRTDPVDGLGAHIYYDAAFTPLEADFNRLPLQHHQADLVVFHGSLHCASDHRHALHEALRVLRPAGQLLIVDAPHYRRAASPPPHSAAWNHSHHAPDAAALVPFTARRLNELSGDLGLHWRCIKAFTDWHLLRALWPLCWLRARVIVGSRAF